ncbi:hypothetical protein BDQ12DRAFT_668135 [Crucibulum laeve]|uniref:Uncharacterized protein n=1 Tax=Crucibulum laeve TaxID=68775 RepID=A0A5C3LS83_9AGAR|nr:hypothetical protein BDQ12DRAFT_668135 [Crucibulum laeve]
MPPLNFQTWLIQLLHLNFSLFSLDLHPRAVAEMVALSYLLSVFLSEASLTARPPSAFLPPSLSVNATAQSRTTLAPILVTNGCSKRQRRSRLDIGGFSRLGKRDAGLVHHPEVQLLSLQLAFDIWMMEFGVIEIHYGVLHSLEYKLNTNDLDELALVAVTCRDSIIAFCYPSSYSRIEPSTPLFMLCPPTKLHHTLAIPLSLQLLSLQLAFDIWLIEVGVVESSRYSFTAWGSQAVIGTMDSQ